MRMLLAGVVALVVGTPLAIAVNGEAVEYQRRQDAISVTRAEEDKGAMICGRKNASVRSRTLRPAGAEQGAHRRGDEAR